MSKSKSQKFGFLWFLLLAIVLLAFAPSVQAQDGTTGVTDDEVNDIAKQMFCPVCENTPLDVCPTQACEQWRETIRLQLAEGKSEQEIKDYFVLQYGDRVLAEPPRRGFNWLVYIIPPLFILFGVLILGRFLRQSGHPAVETSSAPSPTIEGDELVQRLEEELKRRN